MGFPVSAFQVLKAAPRLGSDGGNSGLGSGARKAGGPCRTVSDSAQVFSLLTPRCPHLQGEVMPTYLIWKVQMYLRRP